MKREKIFSFRISPRSPFDFKLTLRKWGGWGWLTPFEVFENNTLWTVMRLGGEPIGLKISSKGTIRLPKVKVDVFAKRSVLRQRKNIKNIVKNAIGADQNLRPFYALCQKDRVLREVKKDLYGMHTGEGVSLFDLAILTVTLQMAPVKRSLDMLYAMFRLYGEEIQFDNKKVLIYPTPQRLSRVSERELKTKCRVGYRAKFIKGLTARHLGGEFPTKESLMAVGHEEAKRQLLSLPGIGDYSADILNPHRGFPLDIWSVKLFIRLFHIRQTCSFREMIPLVKRWGEKRWGDYRGLVFDYILHDLPSLKRKFKVELGNLATDYLDSGQG